MMLFVCLYPSLHPMKQDVVTGKMHLEEIMAVWSGRKPYIQTGLAKNCGPKYCLSGKTMQFI